MAKIKFDVPIDFVDLCTETLNEFGAVRRSSFIRFIELSLGVTNEVAELIYNKLKDRRDIYITNYAGYEIVKADNKHIAAPKHLDVFDSFLFLLEETTESDEKKRTAFANKASFPVDFSFYDTAGTIYKVFIYDAHLAQKLRVYERKKDDYLNMATMIVFPVGTNIQKVELPKIEGPYRHAVVRKSDSGNTVCQMSTMQGD